MMPSLPLSSRRRIFLLLLIFFPLLLIFFFLFAIGPSHHGVVQRMDGPGLANYGGAYEKSEELLKIRKRRKSSPIANPPRIVNVGVDAPSVAFVGPYSRSFYNFEGFSAPAIRFNLGPGEENAVKKGLLQRLAKRVRAAGSTLKRKIGKARAFFGLGRTHKGVGGVGGKTTHFYGLPNRVMDVQQFGRRNSVGASSIKNKWLGRRRKRRR